MGIPSPIEQNRRHIAVLERAIKLGYVELPRRVIAIKPTFINIVLVSQNGSIGRPRKKAPELDAIVKVDQFRSHLLKRNFSNLTMLKLVSTETLERVGRQLVALHQPSERDWARRFGIGAPVDPIAEPSTQPVPGPVGGVSCAKCGSPLSAAAARFCRFNKPRFDGQVYCIPCQHVVAPLAKRSC